MARFLPIYEYSNSRRRLPPDTTELIEQSGMFKKAMGTVFRKAKLIGSAQIRIRYRFQDPEDAAAAVIEQWKHTLHTEQIRGISKITSEIQQQQQEHEQFDGSSDNQSTHNVIHPLDTHPRTSSEGRVSSSATIATNTDSGGHGGNRHNRHNSSSTLVRESTNHSNSNHINKDSANLKRPSSQSSKSSTNFKTNDNNSRSQHGRGDLARDETFINELFKNQLEKMMTANIPSKKQHSLFSPTGSSSSSSSGPSKSRSFRHHNRRWRPGFTKKKTSRRKRRTQRQQRQHNATTHCMSFDWLTTLLHPNKDDFSARGRRYGFQQNDMEVDDKGKDIITSENSDPSPAPATRSLGGQPDDDEKEHGRACRLTRKAKKKARHIISSVDFGDKSFGSRWMQDSFEVVALAHPVADHLIGLAVKTQTQALVRAIIVLANSFVSFVLLHLMMSYLTILVVFRVKGLK